MSQTELKRLVAEFFGTFTLVFVGTGAVIVNDTSGGALSQSGIALSFGLVVLAMIYALGAISGCHLNPAVTIGFMTARLFPVRRVPGYVVAQILGAICASVMLRITLPSHSTLGATLPAGSAFQSFILEVVLTLILMTVILSVSTGAKETGPLAGIAIGAVIAFEAMIGGPVSGASMNPARSIGPAIVSGHFEHLWLYVVAPIMGALLGILVWRVIRLDPHPEFSEFVQPESRLR